MICTILSTGNEVLKCKDEYDEPYLSVKRKLTDEIYRMYNSGCTDFYLNCEYGVPLWSAEIINDLKETCGDIKLHIVIPYEEQPLEWLDEYKDRYYDIIGRSDDEHMITAHYYYGCYRDADEYMIGKSDCFMVFDMSGGSLQCVSYSMKRNHIIE